MNNYKNKFGIYYHIFADNKDFYENTLKKADKIYKDLVLEKNNVRLYQCWYGSKEEAESLNDCAEQEDCLKNKGDFPL